MKILLSLAGIFYTYEAISAVPKDFVILASVKIDSSGAIPKIIISWEEDSVATEYFVYRKLKDETKWGSPIAVLSPVQNEFIDSNISAGIGYEYYLKKTCKLNDSAQTIYDGWCYLYCGIDVPQPEKRGRLLLLVDSSVASPLYDELYRFEYDLIGDGWEIVRYNVERAETFNPQAVKNIKNIILNEFHGSPDSLKAIVLLGRIPVPYSGLYNPDGHENHAGAWPADIYYAELDSVWTDLFVDDTSAERPENHNVPGDGKFDITTITSDIDLEIGRIDFFNLPSFTQGEVEVLRNYLNKNHKFRHGTLKVESRGLIDDQFGMYGEEFASDAWMNYSALLGPQNISEGKLINTMENNSYLWSFGCNSGGYNSVMHIIYIPDVLDKQINGIFMNLFGSYLGDWDSEDNIMRAAIASNPSMLGCMWTGRPFWHFQHMSLGETVGYSTRLSQNNKYLYESRGLYGYRGIHTALMGDPTLRMSYFPSPQDFYIVYSSIDNDNRIVKLVWKPSQENILGYNIYRAQNKYGKFERLNEELITTNEFVDSYALNGNSVYMLRAVKLEYSATGTYFNQSQGVFAEANIPAFSFSAEKPFSVNIYPNPASDYLDVSFIITESSKIDICIYDVTGRNIRKISTKNYIPGRHIERINLLDKSGASLAQGVYYIKLSTNNRATVLQFVVLDR